MDIATVEREGFTVAGISCRTSNAAPHEIGAHWQKFYAGGGAAQIAHRTSDEIYAVYCDYEGDHEKPYTLVIGCEVAPGSAVAPGQVLRAIPKQRYAMFEATGEMPAALIAAWQRVWQAPIERSFDVDFDRHRDANRVQIHVGIR
jgi:predicted transcriptional regulator YdeE